MTGVAFHLAREGADQPLDVQRMYRPHREQARHPCSHKKGPNREIRAFIK
jgi:hypothetical protein